MQLDFVELAVHPIGIGDCPLARIAAAEKGDLDPAITVNLLDAPIAAVLPVLEDLGAQIVGGPAVNVALAHRRPHRFGSSFRAGASSASARARPPWIGQSFAR